MLITPLFRVFNLCRNYIILAKKAQVFLHILYTFFFFYYIMLVVGLKKVERGYKMSITVWIIIAVILAVIETFTIGFLAIWFAIGAAAVAIVMAFLPELSLAAQLIIFSVVSCLLFMTTRKALKKKLDKHTSPPVYSILGKTGIVTKEINSIAGVGQISINGDIWSAKSYDQNLIIPKDTQIEILEIDGVKAVVKPIENISE